MLLNDELKVYRGDDYVVSKNIIIHQPTLGEICDYGEREYFSMINQLVATPQNFKWQLWEKGVDYTTITPYKLFSEILVNSFEKDKTSIVFGDLDFTKFELMKRIDNDEFVLYQIIEKRKMVLNEDDSEEEVIWHEEVVIDEFTYRVITDYLCAANYVAKDEKMPANESTKMILIEDAKEEYMMNMNKEYHSRLKNLVSAMVNSEGFKYNHSQVWEMKINAFMDSVKRISKIKQSDLLLQSGYSGFGVNLKDISNKKIDWLGELE